MAQVLSFNKAQLRKNIDATYSPSELDTLLFDLDIDSGHIAGADKVEKTINLIGYCQRRGRLLGLIDALEVSRPHIQWRQEVMPQPASHETVETRILHRNQLHEQAEGLQLVHTILPSKKIENYWDILIYLIRHKSQDLSLVKQAEFFLGRYWGDEIFTVLNQDDFIGITISAYGPVLCTCRVVLADDREIMLHRYLDFEMTSLFTQNKTDSQTTQPTEPEIMINPMALAERIGQNFNGHELRDLAFDMEVHYENLPARGVHGKARELIAYVQRHQNLPQLLHYLEKHRPYIQWKE